MSLTNLNDKAFERERIVVQHYSSNVTNDLVQTAEGYANRKARSSPAVTLVKVDAHGNEKQSDDCPIARQ